MKKVIKYFFIILLLLVLIVIAFIVFSVNSMNAKTESGKDYVQKVVEEVSTYYAMHGDYPKRLNDLEVFDDPKFITYVNDYSFRYTTHFSNIYTISWRAGPMNWTGYRCTNSTLTLADNNQQVIRTYKMTDEVVCFVSDLH